VSEQEEPRSGAPTIDDVAAAAGVSRSTVSRALGSYGQVSPDARQKIIDAAEKLNYRVNMVARSTRTGRTGALGLIIADVGNRFFSRVTRGFSDTARDAGFQVIIANTDEDIEEELKAIKLLQEGRVDGIALAPAQSGTPDQLLSARAAHVPMVTIDRRISDPGIDTVLLNSRAAAKEAVSHLVEAGHRRIAVATGLTALFDPSPGGGAASPGSERIAGYADALTEAGLPINRDYILRQGRNLQDMSDAVSELLQRPTPPTAIFATDERHALGTIMGIQAAGRSIPHDVSLVAIDDPQWASVVNPPLSVVAQPSYRVGALAAERLIARVQLQTIPAEDFVLDFQWIERDSIAAPQS
jgi:LacI family transcriptional regulator